MVRELRPESGPIRVAMVDDDPYVRAALKGVLSGSDLVSLVGVYSDGAEIVEGGANGARVVLMDVRMPGLDGIRTTEELRKRADPPEVIMLTTFDLDDEVVGSLRAGAAGYLLKGTAPALLIDAICRVAEGETMLSSAITRQLVSLVHSGSERRHEARARLAILSRRERGIASAIGQGRSNAEISADLFISVPTVKGHIGHIFTKLGVSNRLQIALLVHDAELEGPGLRQ